MREVTGAFTHGEPAERTVSREQLRRRNDADAGVRAERLRRRESLLHTLAVARRRRRSRPVTRLIWDPATSWDDIG